jgi:hypothetical protein
MDDEAGKGTPELEAVRKERRALMTRQGQVPTRPGDFSVREAASEKQWDKVSEELQRSELEVDHLNALINGLKRTLADAEVQSGVIDPDAVARYRAEIQTHELELQAYRKQIDGYRQSIEMGRVQTGFGDARYAEDERVRLAFRDAFEREDALAGAGGDADARDYAGSIKPLLAQLRSAEAGLEGSRAKLEAILASQSEDTLSVVRQESATLESYGAQLDALDETSRTLVGEVARDNLTRVRQRLKDVVLRADVGSIQKSWEVRENQRYRVRDLQRERAQEETLINDELREVLDDQENDK